MSVKQLNLLGPDLSLNKSKPSHWWWLIWPILNDAKNLKPQQKGTHLRVLSKSYPMNTKITGFRGF